MKRLIPLVIGMLAIGIIWAQDSGAQRRDALRQLIARAEAGDAKALFDLARLHDTGFDSIPVDTLESNRLYRLSAQKGYAPARNFLGFRYYRGEGVERDVDSALFWIEKAALAGDITGASNLGFLLSQADDINHDYQKSFYWLSVADEANLPSASNQLAELKRKGLGTDPDTVGAVRLYEKAAHGGVREAQYNLLAMMGYKWKELAPDSALALGIKYYTGDLPIAGIDLIEQAARENIPKALAILGDAYSKGIGVEYDHEKSIELFYEAAKEDDPSAQFIIAELLDFFPDALPDESSQYWREKAAEAGITDSEYAYKTLFSYP